MGKAETASPDKNVSGGGDGGASREGGAGSFCFRRPRHNESGSTVRDFDLPLPGRPDGERNVPGSATARRTEGLDQTCGETQRAGRAGEPAVAKRETALRGKGMKA